MRAKRIVNRIRNAGKLLEEGKIQGREIRVRKHSNGGCVDNHLNVLVLLIKIIVKNGAVFSSAANGEDLCRAEMANHGSCRFGGAARAEDRNLFAGNPDLRMREKLFHTVKIGVVAVKLASAVHNGVHRAN